MGEVERIGFLYRRIVVKERSTLRKRRAFLYESKNGDGRYV